MEVLRGGGRGDENSLTKIPAAGLAPRTGTGGLLLSETEQRWLLQALGFVISTVTLSPVRTERL